jgi:hypothetical protein
VAYLDIEKRRAWFRGRYRRRHDWELERARAYRESNRRALCRRQKAWARKKMAEDPTRRVRIYLQIQWKKRCRSRGIYHAEAFLQLLGCAWSQFTGRIDRQRKRNGWTWHGYGSEWTLDHKLPVCAFRLEKYEERAMCSHFSNLQVLSVEQNRRKNGSYSKVELRCFKALWRSRHSRKCRQLRLFKESRDERKPICPF